MNISVTRRFLRNRIVHSFGRFALVLFPMVVGGFPAAHAQGKTPPIDSLLVQVHPGLQPYILFFRRSNVSGAGFQVDVMQQGILRQTFTLEEPPRGGCEGVPSNCVTVRDVNFDGYADLQIFTSVTVHDPDWSFLCFNPKTGLFVTEDTLNGATGTVAVDAARKEVTFSWGSVNENRYGKYVYHWTSDRFVRVREILNERIDNGDMIRRTVSELKKGVMQVVSTTTVTAEE